MADHLSFAASYDAERALTPRLIATVGLPFSGKTTASRMLADAMPCKRVAVDEIMVKLPAGSIEAHQWLARYRIAHARLEELLGNGETVVFDAVNHRHHQRDRLRRIARRSDAGIRFVWIATPEAVVQERRLRNRANPTRPDVPEEDFRIIADDFQPPEMEPDVLRYDGHIPLARWLDDLADALTMHGSDGGLAFRHC